MKEVEMYCPACGARLDDDALFCSDCGEKLSFAETKGVHAKQEDTVLASASSETQSYPREATSVVVPENTLFNSEGPSLEETETVQLTSIPTEIPLDHTPPAVVAYPHSGADAVGNSYCPTAVQSNRQPDTNQLRSNLVSNESRSGQLGSYAPMTTSHAAQSRNKSTRIMLGVLAAGLVLAAAFAWFSIHSGGRASVIDPASPEYVSVDFALDVEDGLDTMSGVPIQITGTDIDGNPVDTKVIYHPKANPVSLRPGNYIAKLFSSPVSEDDKLYSYSDKTYEFSVPDTGGAATSSTPAKVEVAKDAPITLTKRDATEEEVSAAKKTIEETEKAAAQVATQNTQTTQEESKDNAQGPVVASEPENGQTQPTSIEKEVQEPKVDKAALFNTYLDIVEKYDTAVNQDANTQQTFSEENNLNFETITSVGAGRSIRYAYHDINDDGIEELLIGLTNMEPFVDQVFASPDVEQGSANSIVQSGGRLNVELQEEGKISQSYVGMNGEFVAEYYDLTEKTSQLELIESVSGSLAKPGEGVTYTDESGKTEKRDNDTTREVADKYHPLYGIDWKYLNAFDKEADKAYLDKLNNNPEQAKKDMLHYENNCIAFDMPESWLGFISGDAIGHTSGMYHVDFNIVDGLTNGLPLVFRVDGMAGSGAGSCSWIETLGSLVWEVEKEGSTVLSGNSLDQLILATTGGSITREELIAQGSKEACNAEAKKHVDKYMTEFVVPNVVYQPDTAQAAETSAPSVDAANFHVATDYYEFDIPEYWRDKVELVQDTNSTHAAAINALHATYFRVNDKWPDESFVSILCYPKDTYAGPYIGGDWRSVRSIVGEKYVCDIIWESYFMHLNDTSCLNIDLATGGQYQNLEGGSNSTGQSCVQVGESYIAQVLGDSLKVK